MDRADVIHQKFRSRLQAGDLPIGTVPTKDLPGFAAMGIFRAQCASRHIDRLARQMQRAGRGFYTIGSSGHEGMAAVAEAVRNDDIAFLHYRDAAFQIRRAMRVSGTTPIRDLLLSFTCSRDDPVSGGRHKVLGSFDLCIPPQTSTIASHLPKAVGTAFSIGIGKRLLKNECVLSPDSIVICSFGDASCNHSTAQGAINTACWTSIRKLPLPLLFVCEDNGIGISVRTPSGWVAANFSRRHGLKYFHANGLDILETYTVAKQAADYVREHRKPAFLHLSLVRLLGHAGSDHQTSYLSDAEIEIAENQDPLLHSARFLSARGITGYIEMLGIYDGVGAQCQRVADDAVTRPHLKTAAEVMSSLIPPPKTGLPEYTVDEEKRLRIFGPDARRLHQPQPMSRLIGWTLTDLMLQYREVVLAGQDIGRKGGVYGVTQRLQERFGPARVMDTLLDEQSILGLAIGMAHNGFLPIPEIQFMAYLHNAEDQLRGEAATLSFFSNGQYTNPMVVRVAGLGYQSGFGGHFHNDNSLAVLRDIPGIILACPSNGADAAGMLRECFRLARQEQRVIVFVEPIALYGTRDLHEEKDNAWAAFYPDSAYTVPYGEVGVWGEERNLAIVSYGNGFFLAHQAKRILEEERNIGVRLIDLRWLSPLPECSLIQALEGVDKVLIVDECRRSGNVSEGLMVLLLEKRGLTATRLTAEDSFIATGPASAATLPSRDDIVKAACQLVREGKN